MGVQAYSYTTGVDQFFPAEGRRLASNRLSDMDKIPHHTDPRYNLASSSLVSQEKRSVLHANQTEDVAEPAPHVLQARFNSEGYGVSRCGKSLLL